MLISLRCCVDGRATPTANSLAVFDTPKVSNFIHIDGSNFMFYIREVKAKVGKLSATNFSEQAHCHGGFYQNSVYLSETK